MKMELILAQHVPFLQGCGFAAYFLRATTQKETQQGHSDCTRKKQRELTARQNLAGEEFSLFPYRREYETWVI